VSGWIFNSEPERDLALRLYGLDPFAPTSSDWASNRSSPIPAVPIQVPARFALRIYSGRREPLKGLLCFMDYLAAFPGPHAPGSETGSHGKRPDRAATALAPHIHDLGFVSEETSMTPWPPPRLSATPRRTKA